jgi:hypothetical protein
MIKRERGHSLPPRIMSEGGSARKSWRLRERVARASQGWRPGLHQPLFA